MALRERAGGGTGTLDIVVVDARGLMACDTGGTSDPYCSILLGKTKRKTKTIKKTIAPVWNHLFTVDTIPAASNLVFEIFDHDLTSKDDFMGQAIVDIAQLTEGEALDTWLPLQPKAGEPVSGELHVIIDYVAKVEHGEDWPSERGACGECSA